MAGAYFLARGSLAPQVAQASTESALLQAIATRDSTGDGLPDWEKTLYGIPLTATTTDYFHLGMTDGEAVAKGLIVPKALADVPVATSTQSASTVAGGPAAAASGSLTDVFAKNFFTLYLSAKEGNNGTALSQDQLSSIATQAFQMLAGSVAPAPDFKQASDLTVSGSGSDALTQYADNAAGIFEKFNAHLPKSELEYLQGSVMSGDTSASAQLTTIAQSYEETAAGLSALPVPQEAATADLALVNATARLGSITEDFSHVDTDPLSAMLALQQYPSAVQGLAAAFQSLAVVYQSAHVTLDQSHPGAALLTVLQSIATTSTATTTP